MKLLVEVSKIMNPNKKPTAAYFRYNLAGGTVKVRIAGYSTLEIPSLTSELQIDYRNQDRVRRNSELLENTFDWFQLVT